MKSKYERTQQAGWGWQRFVAVLAIGGTTILAALQVPALAQTNNINFPAPTTYLASDPGCTGFCPSTTRGCDRRF